MSVTVFATIDVKRTNVEVQRAGRRSLCDNTKTHANLLLGLGVALLQVRVVANVIGELIVCVELVRVGIWVLGGSERVDLVRADFEVLLNLVRLNTSNVV